MGSCDGLTNIGGCVSMGYIHVKDIKITGIGSITGRKSETCVAVDNLWYWRLNYSDTTGNNPEIEEDLTVENGRSVLEALEEYSSSRELPETDEARAYRTTWIINPENAKLTARVNKRVIDSYNTSIVLLPTFLDGARYHFDGWYSDGKKVVTSEVREETTFDGEWEKEVDKKKLTIIIVVVVVVVVLAIIATVSSIYGYGYAKRRKEMVLLRELLYPAKFDNEEPENSLNRMEGLYPEDYTTHGEIKLREALRLAGLNEKQASTVMAACYENARRLGEEDKLPQNLTVDDAAALAMYTFDFGTDDMYNLNPYRIINSALNNRTEENMEKAKDILYLVMKALRKLPVVFGRELHRGIRVDVSENADRAGGQSRPQYTEGSIITWSAMSSTSPDMTVTKSFLKGGSKTGKAAGTLFIISNGWGYDIQPYSLFPTESEILVEPERQFKVVSIIPAELTIIKLEMLKTPIILPDIYGRHDFFVPALYFVKERMDEHERNRRRKLRAEQEEHKKEVYERHKNQTEEKSEGERKEDRRMLRDSRVLERNAPSFPPSYTPPRPTNRFVGIEMDTL